MMKMRTIHCRWRLGHRTRKWRSSNSSPARRSPRNMCTTIRTRRVTRVYLTPVSRPCSLKNTDTTRLTLIWKHELWVVHLPNARNRSSVWWVSRLTSDIGTGTNSSCRGKQPTVTYMDPNLSNTCVLCARRCFPMP
uniref:Uncharacterized protein n=1 Tax=Cacopsylla melanoneura TaxID=428564 RepID=A0A8D8X3L1_9HEMI